MVFYGDIINSRTYDAILARNRRKSPILVLNNEYSNVDDPMLHVAKELAISDKRVALSDMKDNTEYIPPELTDSE